MPAASAAAAAVFAVMIVLACECVRLPLPKRSGWYVQQHPAALALGSNNTSLQHLERSRLAALHTASGTVSLPAALTAPLVSTLRLGLTLVVSCLLLRLLVYVFCRECRWMYALPAVCRWWAAGLMDQQSTCQAAV